jgi:hypothetical protein
MKNFKSTLEHCQLSDLGFSGPNFTWCNQWDGPHFTKERLDRVVANREWFVFLFLWHKLEYWLLEALTMHHFFFCLSLQMVILSEKKHRLFRYEA